MISYLDEHAQPQEASFAALPWSVALTTTLSSVIANIMVQGNSQSLGCRIIVDGHVRDEQVSDAYNASTFLSGQSRMTGDHGRHRTEPFVARFVRMIAVPIILAWAAAAVAVNVLVPQLELCAKRIRCRCRPRTRPRSSRCSV